MKTRIFYGWIVVATLFVINFGTQAAGTLNLGLFAIPMGTDMGFSRGVFGWLTASRALAAGVSGLFLGQLLDKIGPRLLIAVAAPITGLCLFGIGASTQVYQLFLCFALIGLAGLVNSGGSFLTSVPVAKWFVRRRGTALALATLGLGVGSITLLPVTQFLIDGVGWRKTWGFMGVICMALIILPALVFLRRQPEDMGLLPDGDPAEPAQKETVGRYGADESVWSVREALGTRAFWLLTASLVLGSFTTGASVHRIPYWVGLGFDPKVVSLSFSADSAGATVMTLGAGLLMDRFPARFVAAGAFAGFAASLSLMLFPLSTSHMLVSVVLFGLSVGINIVSQTYLWASYYGRTFLGAIRGITLPLILLGSAMGAPVVGYIYDYTGSYELAWQLLIGTSLAALLVMLLATPPKRKTQ